MDLEIKGHIRYKISIFRRLIERYWIENKPVLLFYQAYIKDYLSTIVSVKGIMPILGHCFNL